LSRFSANSTTRYVAIAAASKKLALGVDCYRQPVWIDDLTIDVGFRFVAPQMKKSLSVTPNEPTDRAPSPSPNQPAA
jgi:hypothetical protein